MHDLRAAVSARRAGCLAGLLVMRAVVFDLRNCCAKLLDVRSAELRNAGGDVSSAVSGPGRVSARRERLSGDDVSAAVWHVFNALGAVYDVSHGGAGRDVSELQLLQSMRKLQQPLRELQFMRRRRVRRVV
jgi:hypothetical protein